MPKNEVLEGIQEQSADEEIPYQIITTNWGSNPSSPSVKAYIEDSDTDATSTVFPTNEPSVSEDTITLPPMKDLTVGVTYRVEVAFNVGSTVFECYFRVYCDH